MIWRVILVRLPATDGGTNSPHGITSARFTPTVLLETNDEAEAMTFAEKLREEGAAVALLAESAHGGAVCSRHPEHVSGRNCRDCGVPICAVCRVEAEALRLCPTCWAKLKVARRQRRTRILFSVFVFVLFLQQTWTFLMREAELLNPSGPVRALIVQLAPPGLGASGLARTLNTVDGPFALSTVADWYEEEHARYTGRRGRYLDLTVRGPFVCDFSVPPLGGDSDPWWKLAQLAWQYPRYFHGKARSFGVDPDRYAVRVYILYGAEGGDLESESLGSRKGRVAVAKLSADETNPGYALLTIAHEIGHILGAKDRYEPDTYVAQYPDGFVEPHAVPLYPQRFADVMAGDIPISVENEAEVQSLLEVRVGYRTAAEMRWIPDEQAAMLLSDPAADPGKRLPAKEEGSSDATEGTPTMDSGEVADGQTSEAAGPAEELPTSVDTP